MERKCTNLPFLVLMQTSKAIHEKIKKEMTRNNLNITEFSVLEVLYQKGKQTIQQIRNSILISSGSMTDIIDKLEQRDLLSRNACREDRRVIHVTLTDDGNKLMQEIMLKHHKVVDDIFDSLNSDEAETLVNLLKKVRNKVSSLFF
ncbi:MarR family winged helix-turn-helix transcriptional regulator [Priestia filamentosa]|uniref:MarR family winged helix-turn-helix transcriptional regulator n=1 Tax=Priestia filamentosa TaxID=1402861 RepID=UPI000A0837DD|nr:MarR family transcriptional regulator [Priestia filamentosa]MDT3766435.1 MarR family transcriptional regulator [Priestia filamentosa]OXS64038.1 MarR family transcriptional regulator [Priestia filamentosa]SMF76146.1 MarR family transcriptional regulator, 2-MHQ and catechol-resistance regulon repressor [Priestia filamentosa]